MSHVPLTETNKEVMIGLLEQVHPELERQWGSLTPHRMLVHLRFTTELSMGKVPTPDISNPILRFPATKHFMFRYMPWPKGRVKAPPEFTPEPENEFEEDRQRAIESLQEFLSLLKENPEKKTRSPLFGMIPISFWSVMHGRHHCWHLEQFGIDTKPFRQIRH